MSYIELSTEVPPMLKGVISLWFRVPGKTCAEIKEEFDKWLEDKNNPDTPYPERRRFLGIIPLMTFGPTKLKSREFYYPTMKTGDFPGTQEQSWFDGFPDCINSGWKGDIRPQSPGDYTENFYSFNKGNGSKAGGDEVLDGSYIGVDCTWDTPALNICFMMPAKNRAKFEGGMWAPVVNRTWSGVIKNYYNSGSCPGHPPGMTSEGIGSPPIFVGTQCYLSTFDSRTNTETRGDIEDAGPDCVLGCVPEHFKLLPEPTGSVLSTPEKFNEQYVRNEIEPDHWHHVLVSFDFTDGVETEGQTTFWNGSGGSAPAVDVRNEGARTKSAGSMWLSIDDVMMEKEKMSAFWPRGSKNPNDILTTNGMITAQDVTIDIDDPGGRDYAACRGVKLHDIVTTKTANYEWKPDNKLKVEIGTIGMPAHSDYVDAIRHCEMAELQIFTDVSWKDGEHIVETDDPGKDFRRLFVTEEGKPAAPGKAAEFFKKKPEVIIRSAADWKKAKNIGTLAEPPPRGPEEGDYKGKILTYRPNPNLFDKQGEKQ